MWIKNFLKLILIIFSCFSSLLLLFTFGTYFYFFNKNNLSFIDKKGYLSNIISWYVGKEIKFNTISFNINDFNSKHNIIITDFESTDYKNFSEIKVGILSFDCHFIECIRSYQNYTNLNLVKPTMKVVVSKKENYNNNSYYEDLINFIDKAKITNIKDGTVNIHYLEHINEFSNINITKKNNDNDLSIFGYFSYRSNKYADKSDFNIGIYKDEYKSHINIKFYSFAILNSIFESYEVFPFSVSDTLIDGDVNIKVKNGNAETIDFNIISNTGTVILEKSKFKNVLMKDKYIFKNLIFNGSYNFYNQILEYKNFSVSIDEKNYINASILLDGLSDLKFEKNNLNVNINFYDFVPKNNIFTDADKYNELLIKNYSGKSSFKIINNEILDIELYVNDVYLNDLSIKNIKLKKESYNSENDLILEIEGKYENFVSYLDKYNIFNIKHFDMIEGDFYSNLKFTIPNNCKSIIDVKYKANGLINNVIFTGNENKLFIDYENIKSFDFEIDNFNDAGFINLNKMEIVFITENNSVNSFINIQGAYKKHFDNKYDVSFNINFQNLFIKNINNYISDYLNIDSYTLISGKSNVIVKKSNIENLSLNLEDFNLDQISINKINFIHESKINYSKINFKVSSDLENFTSIFNKKYFDENDNLFYLNKLNGVLNSEVEIILDNFEIFDIKAFGTIENIINIDKSNFISKLNINLIKKIDFNFMKNKSKTKIDGVAKIFDSNVNFEYLKNNKNNLFNINFILNNEIRKILNYNNIVDGDSEYNITIYKDNNTWSYDTEINFLKSTIKVPSIKYQKIHDNFANLYVHGKFSSKFLLNNIKFQYKDLENTVHGEVKILSDENIFIDLEKFIFDQNNFSAEINYDLNNNYIIKVKSGILNLDTFLHTENKGVNNFSLAANLDKLFLFNNIELKKSKLIYKYQNGLLNEFSIDSKYFGDENFSLICFNEGNNSNRNKYELIASDAGKFFKTLNYTTEIKGGVFSSEGYFGNIDNDYDIMGTVSIDNFRVMKAPIFAELLLAASLTGIIEVLENDGIEFEQFDAQFFGKDGVYTIIKSRAYGFSLGITGEGRVDSINSMVDIKGSLVPAYKINSFFNNIPIIGEIMSGKEDEGIFAIDYYTKGNWNNLESEINPLSALTPGLLRNIFDFLE